MIKPLQPLNGRNSTADSACATEEAAMYSGEQAGGAGAAKADAREETSTGICSRASQALWVTVLAAASGLACVGLRLALRGLQWIFVSHTGMLPDAAQQLPWERRALTPVIGALCASAVLWLVRRNGDSSRPREYLEAIHLDDGRIAFTANLWRTVSSACSLATGAAVGREGTMIQFAASIASWLGSRSRVHGFSLSRQVSFGVAAAVAAAYQAPIAGIFFATEIVLGDLPWTEAPYFALASLTGWAISRTILGGGPLFAVRSSLPPLSVAWLYLLILAALLGMMAPLYQALLRSLRFAGRWPLALVWGALVVGLLSVLSPAVWGNADVALLAVVHGSATVQTVLMVFALRLVATTFCVGTGTIGGVFTPTLFAGAAVGLLTGEWLHVPQPVLFAVVGLGCLLSAVAHAPWTATFMAVELTGEWSLLPVILVCATVAYQVARRLSSHSLYAIASPEPLDTVLSREHPSQTVRC